MTGAAPACRARCSLCDGCAGCKIPEIKLRGSVCVGAMPNTVLCWPHAAWSPCAPHECISAGDGGCGGRYGEYATAVAYDGGEAKTRGSGAVCGAAGYTCCCAPMPLLNAAMGAELVGEANVACTGSLRVGS